MKVNKTVLIVDDEKDLRDLLRFEFELEGWIVHEAHNGTEAFKVFGDQKIDAIITDVRMPGGDGIQLLDKVHEKSPSTPVLVVTGFADITPQEAMNRGAHAVLTKPFDLRQIYQIVSTAVS